MTELHTKMEALLSYLQSLGSVAVAFSSGVDSTFLLKASIDALGAEHVIAVTAKSCSFPERELKEAVKFCKENHIRHIICESEELDIEGFRHNPQNRCYLCRRELFEKIWVIAKEMGLPTWDKQSFACLYSRFVYGETISEKKLGMVDRVEQLQRFYCKN